MSKFLPSFITSLFKSEPKTIFPEPVIVRLTAEYTQQKHGHTFVDESAMRFTVDFDLHYGCVHAVKAVEVYSYEAKFWVDITGIAMEQFNVFFAEMIESVNWNRKYVEAKIEGVEEASLYA